MSSESTYTISRLRELIDIRDEKEESLDKLQLEFLNNAMDLQKDIEFVCEELEELRQPRYIVTGSFFRNGRLRKYRMIGAYTDFDTALEVYLKVSGKRTTTHTHFLRPGQDLMVQRKGGQVHFTAWTYTLETVAIGDLPRVKPFEWNYPRLKDVKPLDDVDGMKDKV